MKTIYLAGGCFWGLQKFFDQFNGIVHTEAGYANGPAAEPSYRDVCAGSGHAETVRIDYDEERMDLEKLLEYYFLVIDPVSLNRQGNDVGIQYRTGIFYTEDGQLPVIRAVYGREQEKAGKNIIRNTWIRTPEATVIFRGYFSPWQGGLKQSSKPERFPFFTRATIKDRS